MIKIALKESETRKHIYILLITSLLIVTSFVSISYMVFDKVYENNMKSTAAIVGELIDKNPDEEKLIVNSAIQSINNANLDKSSELSKGNQALKTYGYDNRFKFYDDNRNMNLMKDIFIMLVILAIILPTILIYIYLKLSNNFNKKMNIVNKYLESLIERRYLKEKLKVSEGEFGVVEHKIMMLSSIMENSIEEIEKEKNNLKGFISDISHQIKTPISSIKITNSILLDKEEDKTKKEFLISSSEEINRLEWLANSLVKISSIEVGAFQLNIKNQEMKTTLIMALKSVYSKALEKNIEIELEECTNFKVKHDVRWTKEAIANILENAIKYTSAGGKINICLSSNKIGCEIRIKDNGIGIEKDNINKIFKRFYRENSSKVLEQSGSGLGLYIARKVLEAQSASIIVDSKKNKGSIFTIYFYI